MSKDSEAEVQLELYKSLRAESAVYLEKVPALWLQKFILLGAMLAFLLTQQASFSAVGEGDPADTAYDIALGAVAVLACLLDAKILEYSLHARVISSFIETEFAAVALVAKWEQTLWGYTRNSFHRQLVQIRSATTILVTVVPTLLAVVLTSVLIFARRESTWILLLAAVAAASYVAVTIFTVRSVWQRQLKQ